MNRLIPADIVKLFTKHNIKPERGAYFYQDGFRMTVDIANRKKDITECCGIGICVFDKDVLEIDDSRIARQLNIHIDYLNGYVQGFDNKKMVAYQQNAFYRAGYEDGKETAKLAFQPE